MSTNTTNVIGYFNPNEYPLQLSLAEHNVVLQLPAKAYVIDRQGRLVNDPTLDRFVGKGKLARASNPKEQHEIILLRPVNDASQTAAPAAHQHSVSQAQRFDVKDGRVHAVKPVSTAPVVATPPPQSYNPVRGMTVEEAKKHRFIKPTRPVPEDFGADESTGAPKSGQEIPQIRYATDTVRDRKPAPLPPELTQPATPQQAAIIQGLEQAAAINPDDPNVLGKTASRVITETVPPIAPVALPKPQLDEPTAPAPTKFVAPPPPEQRVPTPVVSTEPEAVEASPEGGIVVEDELPETAPEQAPGTESTAPEVDLVTESRVEAALRVPPPPPLDSLACPECGKKVASPSRLRQHVRALHADKADAIMARFTPGSA